MFSCSQARSVAENFLRACVNSARGLVRTGRAMVKQQQPAYTGAVGKFGPFEPGAMAPTHERRILLRSEVSIVDHDVGPRRILNDTVVDVRLSMLVIADVDQGAARRIDAIASRPAGMVQANRANSQTAYFALPCDLLVLALGNGRDKGNREVGLVHLAFKDRAQLVGGHAGIEVQFRLIGIKERQEGRPCRI